MQAVKDSSVPTGFDRDEEKYSFSKSYAEFKPINIESVSVPSEEYNLSGYDKDEEKYGFSRKYASFETFEEIPKGFDRDEGKYGFSKSYAEFIKPEEKEKKKKKKKK